MPEGNGCVGCKLTEAGLAPPLEAASVAATNWALLNRSAPDPLVLGTVYQYPRQNLLRDRCRRKSSKA